MVSKKHLLQIAIAVGLLAFCALSAASPWSNEDSQAGVIVALYEKEEEVCRVCAVVADTPEKREVGLSGVSRLAKFDGMLFPLEESPGTSFWMKNVFFPIDVYFFDGNGSLISGNSMTTCLHSECALYPVPAEAAWALEVPSSVLGVTGTEFSVALVTSETCDGYLVAESVSRSPDR